MYISLRLLALILFCFIYVKPAFAQISYSSSSVNFIHRFMLDDNLSFSSPDYDDSKWPVKCSGASDFYFKNGLFGNYIAWHRIHFVIPKNFNIDQMAVFLGAFASADEIFLNGVRIGGEGKLEPQFIDAIKVERVYKLPLNYLKINEENILAIRALNLYWNTELDNIEFGQYPNLLLKKMARESVKKNIESAIAVIYIATFCACLFLYILGAREGEYIFFGFSVLIVMLYTCLDSLFFYEIGLKTAIYELFLHYLSILLPICIISFVFYVYKIDINLWYYVIVFCCFSLVVAVPVLYDDYSYFYCVEIIYILYICVTCCVGICIAVDGCVKNKHEANILFIGCIFLFCIGIWEMLMVLDIIHIKANFVIYIEDYIFLLFIFSMLYALLSRFVRVHNKVKLLTYNIISAHEEERRRLARELHDGFGQNLQAIKLHLHKIGHALTKQNIKKIVNEVTLAIEELRSICTALRPPFLDEMGIGTALKLYAQKFSRATGLNINVKNISDPFLPRPASEIEDNLFRIAQEALNNVAKHSRAENVIISLKRKKKK